MCDDTCYEMLTENEARYIVRMLEAFRSNTLFLDATTEDAEKHDEFKRRYEEAGRWSSGYETAAAEFILDVCKNGVPGGEYLHNASSGLLTTWLEQRGIPAIERPAAPQKEKEQ